jgi:cytochrome c oxidase subunit 1
MFVTGMSMYAGLYGFSLLSMLVAVPSAIKVFNWTATMFRGSISYQTPMLYAFGFIGLFTIGGLTGLFLATLGVDVHLTDTYFVIAHFHYVMVGGMVVAYLGGLHFWWPKITGKMYPEGWGKFSALLVFVGFNLTFFPQFILGYLGQPRRYHAYAPGIPGAERHVDGGRVHSGPRLRDSADLLLWSLKYGKPAGNNPYGAKGLEWTTQSPPTTFNFDVTPIVTEEAYAYTKKHEEAHVG